MKQDDRNVRKDAANARKDTTSVRKYDIRQDATNVRNDTTKVRKDAKTLLFIFFFIFFVSRPFFVSSFFCAEMKKEMPEMHEKMRRMYENMPQMYDTMRKSRKRCQNVSAHRFASFLTFFYLFHELVHLFPLSVSYFSRASSF